MITSSKTARGRSTAVKSQIDENLKRVYEHALNEEVPDRFKLLLEQLKSGGPVLGDAAAAPNQAPAPIKDVPSESLGELAASQGRQSESLRAEALSNDGAPHQPYRDMGATSEITE